MLLHHQSNYIKKHPICCIKLNCGACIRLINVGVWWIWEAIRLPTNEYSSLHKWMENTGCYLGTFCSALIVRTTSKQWINLPAMLWVCHKPIFLNWHLLCKNAQSFNNCYHISATTAVLSVLKMFLEEHCFVLNAVSSI